MRVAIGRWWVVVGLLALSTTMFDARAQSAATLNAQLMDVATSMAEKLGGRGYNIQASFSEPVQYGTKSLQPTHDGQTMCVSAVAEALARAIQIHVQITGRSEAFEKLPASHFTGTTMLSLRPHLYQWAGANSRGPGDALSRFGIGEVVKFSEMLPGDLLAFNRERTGHAVVFLGYVDRMGKPLPKHTESVAGFKYFSSQGKGLPDAGFGYRTAYFAGIVGPQSCNRSVEDCGVLRNQNLLNAGRVWAPERWDVAGATKRLRDSYIELRRKDYPNKTRDAIELEVDAMLTRPMEEKFAVEFE